MDGMGWMDAHSVAEQLDDPLYFLGGPNRVVLKCCQTRLTKVLVQRGRSARLLFSDLHPPRFGLVTAVCFKHQANASDDGHYGKQGRAEPKLHPSFSSSSEPELQPSSSYWLYKQLLFLFIATRRLEHNPK